MKSYKLSLHDKYIKNGKNNLVKNDALLKNLHSTKFKIDSCNLKKWEIAKKSHNIFEYIYTSSNTNKNMCQIIPISRSYFKLLEILYTFNFFKQDCYISCIAEGPGGFIQCLHDTYNKNNINIKNINGITLISNDKSVPYWNNIILNNNNNNICYCSDNSGDIYSIDNANEYINSHKVKCYLVTSDGGFDFSQNYNNQELSSINLLFSEVYIALNVQEINGNFIIKMFDLLNLKTTQLLYILYLHYDEIFFFKPDTSRSSNSEKYIICKGFKGLNKEINKLLIDNYNINEIDFIVPESFIDDINNFNTIFIKKQIKNINEILLIVKNNPHIKNSPTIIQKKTAIEWCKKYKLEINQNFMY